jgi:L-threonylcarbamoyladenylate synthase
VSTSIPDISDAIDRLRAGGVVAFPTETVYGLGADALNELAVRRVYALKGRPGINPLIVHVSGPDMASRLVADWTPEAAALARMFWPGPLTIVLARPSALGTATLRVAPPPSSPLAPSPLLVPDIVTAGGPTIAVRCPDHPVALSLLFGLGSPLVGPSANLSGQVSPTTAEHVRESFSPDDVLVLEGGPCRTGIESTVVSLATDRPRILRPGLIGAGEIAAVIGRPVEEPAVHPRAAAHSPLPSPGLLSRHYAPRTPARLATADEIAKLLGDPGRAPALAAVIAHERLDLPAPHTLILLPADPEDYAFHIYAALRSADACGAQAILIQRPPSVEGAWSAILDRLTRATHVPE